MPTTLKNINKRIYIKLYNINNQNPKFTNSQKTENMYRVSIEL